MRSRLPPVYPSVRTFGRNSNNDSNNDSNNKNSSWQIVRPTMRNLPSTHKPRLPPGLVGIFAS